MPVEVLLFPLDSFVYTFFFFSFFFLSFYRGGNIGVYRKTKYELIRKFEGKKRRSQTSGLEYTLDINFHHQIGFSPSFNHLQPALHDWLRQLC